MVEEGNMSVGMQLVAFDATFFLLSKEWISDEETSYLINATPLPSDEERQKWYDSLSYRSDYKIWGVNYFGQPVGACGLKHITEDKAEYWGYIGKKALWGKGLGLYLVKEMISVAQSMGLKMLYLGVIKDNIRAFKLYKKMGFCIDNETDSHYYMSMSI